MLEMLSLMPQLAAGALLGVIFFGGLWWTVRKGVLSTRPAFWFLGSLLLRFSIALAGFYLVADGQWQRLLACFLGFVMARYMVTRLSGPPVECQHSPAKEAGNAP
jgi:F1F0 ATPase subunit 2